ncbi:MAG: YdcH family protein [Methylocella sp.]
MSLAAHLAELSEKHKLLERRIAEELARPASSDLEITRMKREKLKLKEEIVKLQGATRH